MNNTHTTTGQLAPILPADDLALVSMGFVIPIVGLKKSALFARVADRRFPAPLRLSGRCSRFRAGDIRAYLRDPLGWNQSKAIDAPKAVERAA